MDLPLVAPLRQTAPQPVVTDVAGETRRQWSASRFAARIRPGDRVAVAVGSRGVANLAVLVQATLDFLRDRGAEPFVVAAMGSHGGATAEGQRQLLAEYGVTESALGAPVKTDMDTEAALASTATAIPSTGTATRCRRTTSSRSPASSRTPTSAAATRAAW